MLRLALLATLSLAGCVAGGTRREARQDRKEVFVEVAALTSQQPRLVPFPLLARDEPPRRTRGRTEG